MATKAVNDASLDNEVKTVGQLLSEQPKVKVKLFLSNEERGKVEAAQDAGKNVVWPYETVSINGYTYQIKRGVEVEVPQSVYEVLSQSNII